MVKRLLRTSRTQLWKFRLMLFWRLVVILLLFAFMAVWVFSPGFIGGYIFESPQCYKLAHPDSFVMHLLKWLIGVVSVLCIVLNFITADDTIVAQVIKNINDQMRDIEGWISSAKTAIILIKCSMKRGLSNYEFKALHDSFEDIGVREEILSSLKLWF